MYPNKTIWQWLGTFVHENFACALLRVSKCQNNTRSRVKNFHLAIAKNCTCALIKLYNNDLGRSRVKIDHRALLGATSWLHMHALGTPFHLRIMQTRCCTLISPYNGDWECSCVKILRHTLSSTTKHLTTTQCVHKNLLSWNHTKSQLYPN